MQDKKSFGHYLLKKRKEANLTQEELANKLFVIPTTISKWERGITYPDIMMITKLCRELNISEHEFFMACDDEALKEEKIEAKKYRTIKKIVMYSLNGSYLLSLVVCLICNLVIDHTLSWFLIVCLGILMSFSITTLPLYLKKNKYVIFKVTAVLTILIYLLLFTVNYVYGGDWLLDSFKIAGFVLVLLWIDVLIWTFCNIRKTFKVSISLIILAGLLSFTNPFINMVCNVSNDSSNFFNVLSAVILIILACTISFKRLRD